MKVNHLNESDKEFQDGIWLSESVEILTEGTKYDKKAAKILADSGLFDLETSERVIDALFHNDIHAFVHAPNWLEKYLIGIAHIIVDEADGDREKAQRFLGECPQVFDEFLTWVKERRPTFSAQDQARLDKRFNENATYEGVKAAVELISKKRNERSQRELANMEFAESDYRLVPIESFEDFHSKYGGSATGDGESDGFAGDGHGGTAWCHTNDINTYNRWTTDGQRFFVLEKKDWRDIPFNSETNDELDGKDDYGNSLIALRVSSDGDLRNATLRCNHVGVETNADNQYKTYADLSRLAGFNVEEAVKKYLEDHGIRTIPIDDSIFVVEGDTFARDSAFTDIDPELEEVIFEADIPSGVTSIQDGCFENLTNLETVSLPSSLKEIGSFAFSGCRSLMYLGNNPDGTQFPNGLSIIGAYAFSGCRALEEAIIPDSCLIIKENAFERSGVQSVKLGYGDNSISLGNEIFKSCADLSDAYIGQGAKSVPLGMFGNCVSLRRVKLEDNIEKIGSYAFAGCRGLPYISLPLSVVEIGDYTFSNCTSLEKIRIPGSVRRIGFGAFRDCRGLRKILYGGTTEMWEAIDKKEMWNAGVGEYEVECTDGLIYEGDE